MKHLSTCTTCTTSLNQLKQMEAVNHNLSQIVPLYQKQIMYSMMAHRHFSPFLFTRHLYEVVCKDLAILSLVA